MRAANDRDPGHLSSRALALGLALLCSGCTAVSSRPPSPDAEQVVDACTLADHLKCIQLTGAETIEDGVHGEWTRHWFRMSYIGRACTREYGIVTGVVIESLFALPHYGSIAIVNGASTLAAPFRSSR